MGTLICSLKWYGPGVTTMLFQKEKKNLSHSHIHIWREKTGCPGKLSKEKIDLNPLPLIRSLGPTQYLPFLHPFCSHYACPHPVFPVGISWLVGLWSSARI